MKRRDFLKSATAAAVAGSILKGRARPAEAAPVAGAGSPVVIATWDFSLAAATAAQRALAGGADLLDALEKAVNTVEDDPKVPWVGYGGVPNEDGVVQLDASIMDGRTHNYGAVAALETIRNPVSVARKVMERTHHVLLAGAGALAFARKAGFAPQDLTTPESLALWKKIKETRSYWKKGHDTICMLAVDARGDLASAVSTSGLPCKVGGRVGDSPIVGAGSYVDNEVGAAAATGDGELTLRTLASYAIVERMRGGVAPDQACAEQIDRIVKKIPELRGKDRRNLAFIALDKQGRAGGACLRQDAREPFRYALARREGAALHVAAARLP
jgi:N4-(beta-N-acetylglucosaminyl)-L-asparaginase